MKLNVRTIHEVVPHHGAVPHHGVEKMIDALALTGKSARKVTVRALNDAARWFKSNAGKEIAKATGVPSAVIKKRFFIRKPSSNEMPVITTISVNLYDVKAKDLGKIMQLQHGAKAGKFLFEGAFKATMNAKRGESIYQRKTRQRFPVREIGLEIKTKADPVLERLLQALPTYYAKRFMHQLNFEMSRFK